MARDCMSSVMRGTPQQASLRDGSCSIEPALMAALQGRGVTALYGCCKATAPYPIPSHPIPSHPWGLELAPVSQSPGATNPVSLERMLQMPWEVRPQGPGGTPGASPVPSTLLPLQSSGAWPGPHHRH